MLLEVGGGTSRRAGYRNLDPEHGDAGLRCLVQDGIPLPDNSVKGVYASHVLEHIPAGQPRIATFNEIHRVLKPKGVFEIVVPCIGFTDHANDGAPVYAGWQGWADPTHVSQWWYPESFWYMDGTFAANATYGIQPWRTVKQELLDGWEAHWSFEKMEAV